MTSGKVMKWFNDHNEILKIKNDIKRRNYLTFLACVLLKVDEEVSFVDEEITINCELEEYSFDSDTELLLKCLNRMYGYSNQLFLDSGFIYLKSKNITNFNGKFSELYEIFHNVSNSCMVYKDDFNEKLYYNGYNTFFYPIDMELTDEEIARLDKLHLDQATLVLYRIDGKLYMY